MGVSVSYKYLNEDHALIGVWVIRYKYKKAMPEWEYVLKVQIQEGHASMRVWVTYKYKKTIMPQWGYELGIGKRSISKMRGTCTKNIFIQK